MPPTTQQFTFYLGTDNPKFLEDVQVPLFISRRHLTNHRVSRTTWALDSGAFTELSMHGRWLTSPGKYAAEARWWYDNVSGMQWAAVQDWMCEDFILKKTGLTVREHQQRTIYSYIQLVSLQPSVPWVPVLQGYEVSEYMNHLQQYTDVGIDLATLPLVGVGSVCRRQSTDVEATVTIFRGLAERGLRLHAFGLKTTGLEKCHQYLVSADSMAWSYAARFGKVKLDKCEHAGVCNHCQQWALQWRDNVLSRITCQS